MVHNLHYDTLPLRSRYMEKMNEMCIRGNFADIAVYDELREKTVRCSEWQIAAIVAEKL